MAVLLENGWTSGGRIGKPGGYAGDSPYPISLFRDGSFRQGARTVFSGVRGPGRGTGRVGKKIFPEKRMSSLAKCVSIRYAFLDTERAPHPESGGKEGKAGPFSDPVLPVSEFFSSIFPMVRGDMPVAANRNQTEMVMEP
jgi:hypothetical protein